MACLRRLAPVATGLDFYLGGGTAVALHLGHRRSVEFRPALLEPLVEWPALGCRLASCPDLAAMKLLAVAQRGTKKDFIDVHALAEQLSLRRMLDCYQQRFGVSDTSRLLASLCFFDDAEAEPMPTMLVPLEWETVKRNLQAMVRQFAA